MRVRITSNLPKVAWSRRGDDVVWEGTLHLGRTRLRAKLLLFRTRGALRRFWWKRLRLKLSGSPMGVVNKLRTLHTKWDKHGRESQYIGVDRRYVCVIGISLPHATAEVAAHEAVHAAYAYAARVRRTPWDQEARRYDEEAIAYPAGEIARLILKQVHKLTGKLVL